jgi:hypothetical protein
VRSLLAADHAVICIYLRLSFFAACKCHDDKLIRRGKKIDKEKKNGSSSF